MPLPCSYFTFRRSILLINANYFSWAVTIHYVLKYCCTIGTGAFLGVMQRGSGIHHPPASSAEVKERVELYFCSPSGSSWPVLGWTLPFTAKFSVPHASHVRLSAVCCFWMWEVVKCDVRVPVSGVMFIQRRINPSSYLEVWMGHKPFWGREVDWKETWFETKCDQSNVVFHNDHWKWNFRMLRCVRKREMLAIHQPVGANLLASGGRGLRVGLIIWSSLRRCPTLATPFSTADTTGLRALRVWCRFFSLVFLQFFSNVCQCFLKCLDCFGGGPKTSTDLNTNQHRRCHSC